MTTDHRRTEPRPGSLEAEIRTLLAAAGYPSAETDDRAHAHGVLITAQEADDYADVEWFISRTAREAAALEQREGHPSGPMSNLHITARDATHTALYGILAAVGYDVRQNENATLRVYGKERTNPARLASVVKRFIGELEARTPPEEQQPTVKEANGKHAPKPPTPPSQG